MYGPHTQYEYIDSGQSITDLPSGDNRPYVLTDYYYTSKGSPHNNYPMEGGLVRIKLFIEPWDSQET